MIAKKIISLNINILNYSQAVIDIISLAKKRIPSYVCFANVHMVIEAYWNSNLAINVNNANLVTADGVPLKLALKILYGIYTERIAGMDMMPSLIKECEKEKLSIGFYGSSDQTLNAIKERIKAEHPNLTIACQINPPFKEITFEEKTETIQIINASKANIVFVCLGCPKQEMWMAENSKEINAILLGVGGAFQIYAKERKRAPEWMRTFAMEWLFRFLQEPKRMLKRYFITNSLFIFLLIKEFFVVRFLKKSKE